MDDHKNWIRNEDGIKVDKLIARMGIALRYRPAYSLWLNGINERYCASCDMTIRKWMEEKKVALMGSLVMAAAWTNSTNVNEIGYTLL